MRFFLILMAIFSRILPGKASDVALRLMTTPRPQRPVESREGFPPESELPVGRRASLKVWGGGSQRVLFVHGWSGNWQQFQPLLKTLGRERYSFYALEMPGHGRVADGASHVGEFITTLRLALDVIGEPVDLLVGHSMGAAAAAYVLAERDDVGRAILVAPPTDFRGVVGRMAGWLQFGVRARQQLLNKMAQRVGMGYDALDLVRRGARIGGRVLLVHDRRDREVPFADSARLYQSIPAATLQETDGKGHRRVLSDPTVLSVMVGFASEGVVSLQGPAADQARALA